MISAGETNSLRWGLLAVAVVNASCVTRDTGVNPPPAREAPSQSHAAGSEADGARLAARGTTPPIQARETVVIHLADQLEGARRELPGVTANTRMLEPSIRSYVNPWAQGQSRNLRYRMSWAAGSRNQWNMRDAVVLPANGRVTWTVKVPHRGRLRFDYACGSPKGGGPVRTELRIGETVVWRDERAAGVLDTLTGFEEALVELAGWAGQTVDLELVVEGPKASGSERVLLAEPVITTRDPVAAREGTGLEAAYNILWVVVDAQRADTLTPSRQRRNLPAFFPNMEALIASGTTFSQARSVANQTRLSTMSFLSSQYPGYARFATSDWDLSAAFKSRFYAGNPPLLPRLLRRLGYRTHTIGNDLFLFGNEPIGLDAGWDRVADFRHALKDTGWMTEEAITWLEKNHDQRFFLLLNYNAPHNAYWPPDESWLAFKPKLKDVTFFKWPYLGEIKVTDEHLERVLATVDRLKLADNTLVIFTSDHGEIMDRGHACFNKTVGQRCLWNHGMTLFDEEVHVPLTFRLPGRIAEGLVLDTPVSQIDISPTILGLLGVEVHPDQLGRDLSGLLLGTGDAPREVPHLLRSRFSTGLAWKGLKYIVHAPDFEIEFFEEGHFDPSLGREELYDLTTDPDEHHNRAGSDPVRLEMMRNAYRGLHDALIARRPSWTSLRLHAPDTARRFVGRITVADGRFVHLEKMGADIDARLASSTELQIDGAAGAGLRFYTDPPDAALTIDLSADGVPIGATELFVGAYGLRLLRGTTLSDFEQAAAARAGPTLSHSAAPGVYVWRETTVRTQPVDGASMDGSVKTMMKDWGYE